MQKLAAVDLAIVVGYLVLMIVMGAWLARRGRTASAYMSAGGSLPGWAVALSIFGSYISSISFLANPGTTYSGNWNPFVFSLATPVAALLAVRYFVPFYRRAGHVSAYHHLEHRFGPWARTYAVLCFLALQVTRMGTIMYLLALALAPLTGWDIRAIILVIGTAMTLYTLWGGIEAVVWTGVVQSALLAAGLAICVVSVLLAVPGGMPQVLSVAAASSKLSLGSWSSDLSTATVWVMFVNGLVTHLQNFAIDQSYVQRYVTARSDKEAARSVWLAMLLYIPVAAGFFFIGTALFVLYQQRPELLADVGGSIEADKAFPHFIAHGLPVGLTGLVIAALVAAAMDSNLNNMATLTLLDVYRRYLRPLAGDRESLLVLRASVFGWGVLGISVAMAMIQVRSALDAWWKMASIFSGGMLGLFLLGIVSKRVDNRSAMAGVIAGVLMILWMTLSGFMPEQWAAFRSPFHPYLIIVIGTLTILVVGLLCSLGKSARSPDMD